MASAASGSSEAAPQSEGLARKGSNVGATQLSWRSAILVAQDWREEVRREDEFVTWCRTSHLAVTEKSAFRKAWDACLLVPLIYVGLVFPYKLAFFEFNSAENGEMMDPFWNSLDTAIDYFFYIDLFAGFIFTYRDKRGIEVVNLGKIALNYLRTYFFINLFACIPPWVFDFMFRTASATARGGHTPPVNQATRMLRVTRLSRLFRLLRLLRLPTHGIKRKTVWARLQGTRKVRILKDIIILFWIVHLLACGWYIVAMIQEDPEHPEDSWIERRNWNNEAQPFYQWITAMYFVFTVFTTVGFGDISPYQPREMVYGVLTMMLGTTVYAMICSEMVCITQEMDENIIRKRFRRNLLKAFCDNAGMSKEMEQRLLDWADESGHGKVIDKTDIRTQLVALPRRILGILPDRLFRGCLLHNEFVAQCARACQRSCARDLGDLGHTVMRNGSVTTASVLPPRFPVLLALCTSLRRFCAGEYIYQMHDHPVSIFIVLSGAFANVQRHGKDVAPDRTRKEEREIGEVDQAELQGRTAALMVGKRASVGNRWTQKKAQESRELSRDTLPVTPYRWYKPGSYFGDSEVLVSSARRASVRCEESGATLVLHKEDLGMLLADFPHFGQVWKEGATLRESHRLKRLARSAGYERCLTEQSEETVPQRQSMGCGMSLKEDSPLWHEVWQDVQGLRQELREAMQALAAHRLASSCSGSKGEISSV